MRINGIISHESQVHEQLESLATQNLLLEESIQQMEQLHLQSNHDYEDHIQDLQEQLHASQQTILTQKPLLRGLLRQSRALAHENTSLKTFIFHQFSQLETYFQSVLSSVQDHARSLLSQQKQSLEEQIAFKEQEITDLDQLLSET